MKHHHRQNVNNLALGRGLRRLEYRRWKHHWWILGSLWFAVGSSWAAADDVLVQVGERKVTLAEGRQLVRRAPAPFPPSSTQSSRALVDEWLVPRLLLEHHAQHSLTKTDTGGRLRDAALNAGLERQLLAQTSVTDEEVAAFYEKHRGRYVAPAAVAVWRILVEDAALAQQLITELRGRADVTRWGELVRKHSLDKATHQRNGSLGFVQPNGNTDVPQVRVSPEVFEAVSKVKDGELVPEPLAVGDYHALLWRRGTRPPQAISLSEASGSIRQVLQHHKAQQALEGLLVRLRTEQLTEFNPELLEAIEYPPLEGIPAAKVPLRPRAAEADPTPTQRDRGER